MLRFNLILLSFLFLFPAFSQSGFPEKFEVKSILKFLKTSPTPTQLEDHLGKPDRVEKKMGGSLYVYADEGISLLWFDQAGSFSSIYARLTDGGYGGALPRPFKTTTAVPELIRQFGEPEDQRPSAHGTMYFYSEKGLAFESADGKEINTILFYPYYKWKG